MMHIEAKDEGTDIRDAHILPTVKPGTFTKPREGSKKASREEDAKSSNMDAKAGGSNGLPFAM